MKLSVIVIDDSGPEALARCLDSLKSSLRRLREVFQGAPPETLYEVLIRPAEQDVSPIRARAEAVAGCTGDVVAFLDSRYRVGLAWAVAMLEAHAKSDVVGGCVGLAPQSSVTPHAIYLWEYGHIVPPLPPGPVPPPEATRFAAGNISYKRNLLLHSAMGDYCSELEFHLTLASQGARFYRRVDATAEYVPPHLKSYLRERYRISLSQARRAGASRSALQRLLIAFFRAVALAPWLLANRVWRVLALKSHRRKLIPVLPWFLVFAGVQAAGEVIGYLLHQRTEAQISTSQLL